MLQTKINTSLKDKDEEKKDKHKTDLYNIAALDNDFNLLAKSGTKLTKLWILYLLPVLQEGNLMIAMREFSRVFYEWNSR